MRRRDVLLSAGSTLIVTRVAGCDSLRIASDAMNAGIEPLTPVDKFYVYNCCGNPDFAEADWLLELRDDDTVLADIDAATLHALPAQVREHTLQCIGGNPKTQLINNSLWGGMPLRELLDELGVEVPAGAVEMVFEGMDDYHDSIPVADLDDAPVWIVWQMGPSEPLEPLNLNHGGPARLLIPGRYGIKNLKWIRSITFSATPHVGYWPDRGWDAEAVYKCNGFIATPPDGTSIKEDDELVVIGTAYAGSDPIERVEFSEDDGATWVDATIDYPQTPIPDVWTLWRVAWTPRKGTYTFRARVTSVGGQVSVDDPDGTDRLIGYDGGMAVDIKVKG